MNLNALRSFILVAETLNFTTVAERRNTVQSAISGQIAKLENELGRSLITRGRGQPMSLTPEGEAMVVYARRMLALADEARDTIRAVPGRPTLRLGTTVTLALSVVNDVLRDVAKALPEVQIHIQCDRSDALLARLDQGEIDVAFMMDQGRRKGRAFVQSEPLVWAAGPGFSLGSSADVPLAFLTDGRDLRHYALDALDRVGRRGFIAHTSPHPIGVRAFVASGLALTVMPRSSIVAPLDAARCELPTLAQVALAAYAPPGPIGPEVQTLLTLLQATLAPVP